MQDAGLERISGRIEDRGLEWVKVYLGAIQMKQVKARMWHVGLSKW
jgi:hypothetical protein